MSDMTTPDTRDSVERIVAEMLAVGFHEEIFGERAHDWADRLSAIPQQAGGEDVLQAEVARRTDSVIVVGATSLACSSAVKEMFDLMSQRAEAAEAALREAHTLPETWRNKWDGGCCCDAAGHECADALDAAIGGTGDA